TIRIPSLNHSIFEWRSVRNPRSLVRPLCGRCQQLSKNGTSGDDGVVSVVICTDSGGGVKLAVDSSIVKLENTGGETNCVS
ncbi:hypothetical protein L195_g055484, partial [Trifolium pratense]